MLSGYPQDGETVLEVKVPTMLSQEQLFRLFDLIPGLDFCDLDTKTGRLHIQGVEKIETRIF